MGVPFSGEGWVKQCYLGFAESLEETDRPVLRCNLSPTQPCDGPTPTLREPCVDGAAGEILLPAWSERHSSPLSGGAVKSFLLDAIDPGD